jgi:hypothetical protein
MHSLRAAFNVSHDDALLKLGRARIIHALRAAWRARRCDIRGRGGIYLAGAVRNAPTAFLIGHRLDTVGFVPSKPLVLGQFSLAPLAQHTR